MITANLAAATSIFVDGSKPILGGREDGVPFYRMADSFRGGYSVPEYIENFVIYPRSLGVLTGWGDPTYDDSEGEGTANTIEVVRKVKNDPTFQPGDPIHIVGYSQGAGAASAAITELEGDEFAGDNLQFVLASNPSRNDGGILTRFPEGFRLPIIGVSFGEGVTTTDPDTDIVQVTKQYDGVADAPDYVVNVVADVNAVLGFAYLHAGYYKDVDRVDPETLDPDSPPEGMLVSTNTTGTVTDVVLEAPVGELPLTMPLRQLGVSTDVVVALDPFLRSVIETGYDRPVGSGAYPDEPEPFRLAPRPDQRRSNAASVAEGLAETKRRLGALHEEDGSADQVVDGDAGSLEPGPEDDDRHDRNPSSSDDPADAAHSVDDPQEAGQSPERFRRHQTKWTSTRSRAADDGVGTARTKSAPDAEVGAHRSPGSRPVRRGDTEPRARNDNSPRREDAPTSGHRYGAGRQAASITRSELPGRSL
ncbi:PE-PPE domain-containing protein [Mycolicibacterium pyrenivorans]|uniref:PE-PPE domain-containing protein n=1 Tax=Mycolicibacterium pyrenivorans TaxID=187102 RepID=UPI0021F3767E|nr:PE-PPE domain-containing protein [Mycolicibacterium pyrenivorans]MCV7154384.1 PE-PPE domain-containing protein [Mycolicibacterium pyrenivorans]